MLDICYLKKKTMKIRYFPTVKTELWALLSTIILDLMFFLCSFRYSVTQLTEFSPQELIEKTLYQFIHAADVQHIRDSHMICKSQLLLRFNRMPTSYEIFLPKKQRFFHDLFLHSNVQRSSDNEILSISNQIGRLDLDAIICDCCTKFTFVEAIVYS